MQDIIVPDIGDFDAVEVIEVIVKPGDTVAAEDPLITLESDKATMDIPAPDAGTVAEVLVKVGDKVSAGSLIGRLQDGADGGAGSPGQAATAPAPEPDSGSAAPAAAAAPAADPAAAPAAAPAADPGGAEALPITVPDMGDFGDVPVIEVLVKPGDTVAEEDPLITLESDKATMDIPAPAAGEITAVAVAVGDTVSEGTVIGHYRAAAGGEKATPAPAPTPTPEAPPPDRPDRPAPPSATAAEAEPATAGRRPPPALPTSSETVGTSASARAYAGPAMRKFARELGVDLGLVKGTGRKGRIQREDIKQFIKGIMSGTASAPHGGFSLPEIPPVDFSRYGEIETAPLSKIRRLTGQNLQRSWLNVPHVTQFHEADITDLEAFRKSKLDAASDKGVKLTLVSFLVKAAVVALQKFPDFNSSLSPDGESIIRKHYFHIGVAVNTPGGLVVPVIRDADQKGLFDIAGELAELSAKARDRKIAPAEMQGGCFTVSSLGGLGGTSFTPIINVPEVAILGVSRASMQPVYDGNGFQPRLMLPLALSYDHRVIDGVAGAAFTDYLSEILGDIRQILL